VANVGVIGLGNWGTALAEHLARAGHTVIGWDRESSVVSGVKNNHLNPIALTDIELHHNLDATYDINEAAAQPFVILVVSSSAMTSVLKSLKMKPGSVLVSAIKGLDSETLETPIQVASRILSNDISLACLSGPSFARDVIADKPCSVVAASADEKVARSVAELFTARQFRAYTSTDTLGVELGGVLKNVIAVAAGAADGLELGDSARMAVMTRGLHEITRLAVAMGAKERTLSGLSGMGDLMMTASSTLSRNRTVGFKLGQGERLESILNSLGSVAEGVRTAEIVEKLSIRYKVEMPISERVLKLIRGIMTPEELLRDLLARPIKSEF
jgi:glycerol-3-phosphate dehydrogenase (NAD(P)+)